MRKAPSTILIFLFVTFLGQAAALRGSIFAPIITMTTQQAPGSTIMFTISMMGEFQIQVDWGDGALVDYTVNFTSISGTLVGSQTITVYGDPTFIEFFECAGNQLSSLDVRGCASLSELDCSGNNLTDLDLTGNTSLNSLRCLSNQLTTLDISACRNLSDLDCSFNPLTGLDLSGNTQLWSLTCMNNQFSDGGLTGLEQLTNLRSLDLSHNPINELPDLTSLTKLWTIMLDGCSLVTLPAFPVSMKRIWASMESLAYLPDLSSLVNLEILSIVGSSVTSIPDMSANTKLETLRCWSGELRSIPDLSAHANMGQLYCRNNKLTFEDLEPNIGVPGFQYLPQDSLSFGEEFDTSFCVGGGMTLTAWVDGVNNVYQWYKDGVAFGSPSGNNSLILNNLEKADEGTYHCVVTNSLVTGMSMTGAPAHIHVYDQTSISATVTDDLCHKREGAIVLFASGGPGPYNYYWSNGERSSTITNLYGGEYRVTVRDANACEVSDTFYIEENPYLSVDPAFQNVSCGGSCDGSANVSVSGGAEPYAFSWADEASGASRSDLCAGFYRLTVSDANGCSEDTSIWIQEPEPLILELLVEDVYCGKPSGGSVTAILSGGKAPYDFTWDNGASTQNLEGLSAGTYTLTVTDANECVVTAVAEVKDAAPVSLSVETTQPSCKGFSDGSIDLSVSGGVPPYSYEWNIGSAEEDLSDLEAGYYSVQVHDSIGCADSVRLDLEEPDRLAVLVSINQLSCTEDGDASAAAEVSGGTEPFSYSWSNGGSSSSIENLEAGLYDLLVQDAKGCEMKDSARILESEPFQGWLSTIDPSCKGMCDGSVSADISGGEPPYSYMWNTGLESKDLTDLCAGEYIVQISDNNACELILTGTLKEPELDFSISGKVQYSGGSIGPDDADVILFDASTLPYTRVSAMPVQAEGAFRFDEVPEGVFVVFVKVEDHARQQYKGVTHSYFERTHQWQEASVVELTCEDSVFLDLHMFENPASQVGTCTVKGKVAVKGGHKMAVASSLPDVSLFLMEKESDTPVDFSGADSEGNYEFINVAPGQYSVLVDAPGFDQNSAHEITVIESVDLIQGLDYELEMADEPIISAIGTPTSNMDSPMSGIDVDLFPNPAKRHLTVRSPALIAFPAKISLISEQGAVVQVHEIDPAEAIGGEISIPLDGLSPGSFFIRIETEDQVTTRKIVVVD